MPALGGNYNPASVMMNRPSVPGSPYLNSGNTLKRRVGQPARVPMQPFGGTMGTPSPSTAGGSTAPSASASTPSSGNVLKAQTVRATGSGPFDASYRQNLATYAGGQSARPGGNLSFNPTDFSTFPGQATGGGNAPILGMPNTLADLAIGGQPFSWTPPANVQPSAPNQTLQAWIDQFLRGGSATPQSPRGFVGA